MTKEKSVIWGNDVELIHQSLKRIESALGKLTKNSGGLTNAETQEILKGLQALVQKLQGTGQK